MLLGVMNKCSAQPFCSKISRNIWQISTTVHFDRMRTAFPCLIAEETNDSVFFKHTKNCAFSTTVHLICILFHSHF